MIDYIQGTDLETLWLLHRLKAGEQDSIVNDMVDIISQLRTLNTTLGKGVVASTLGGAILDYRIGSRPLKLFGEEVATLHQNDYRTIFSHADLAPRNIIIRHGRIVGVVNWALAGWYPEYWELTKMYFTSFKVPEWYEGVKDGIPIYADELVAERILWTLYDEPGNARI